MTMQAFRLSIGDAMALFHLLNEGVMRILTVYFEMERPQASQALEIYKMFAKITEKVVELFDIARKIRGALGIEVPIFKHVNTTTKFNVWRVEWGWGFSAVQMIVIE